MKSAILMALAILAPIAAQAQGLGEFGLPQEPARTPRAAIPAPTTDEAPSRVLRPTSQPPRATPSPAKPVTVADRRMAAFRTAVNLIRTTKDGKPWCEPLEGGTVRQIDSTSILVNIGHIITAIDIPTSKKRYTIPGKIVAISSSGSELFNGYNVYRLSGPEKVTLEGSNIPKAELSGPVVFNGSGSLAVANTTRSSAVVFSPASGFILTEFYPKLESMEYHLDENWSLRKISVISNIIFISKIDARTGVRDDNSIGYRPAVSVDEAHFSDDGNYHYYTWKEKLECSDKYSECYSRMATIRESAQYTEKETTTTLRKGKSVQHNLIKNGRYLLERTIYEENKFQANNAEYYLVIYDVSSKASYAYQNTAYYSLSPDESDVALIKTDCSVEFVKLP